MLAKSFTAALFVAALISCKEKPAPVVESAPPKGEKVVVTIPAVPAVVVETPPAPTPPEEEIGVEEPMVPESEIVIGEDAPSATPGEHFDHAIQKTGEGIQKLGKAIERKAAEKSR